MIILLLILVLVLVIINIYLIQTKKNKKGGNIKTLLIQSNLETKEIEKNVNLLKNSLLDTEYAINLSETDKIKKFINENEVTKFVTKKDKKEYSLLELINLIKSGNMPQGTIYTTSKNNTYTYY